MEPYQGQPQIQEDSVESMTDTMRQQVRAHIIVRKHRGGKQPRYGNHAWGWYLNYDKRYDDHITHTYWRKWRKAV